MSKRYEIIDGIRSSGGEPIELQSIEAYKTIYAAADFEDDDQINKRATNELINDAIESISVVPFIYNLPAESETPIIVNFEDSTIKIGTASAVGIGTDLSVYQANPDVKFKLVVDGTNERPIGDDSWIVNEEYADDTYTQLVALTIQPIADGDGLTMYNTNIIIKP